MREVEIINESTLIQSADFNKVVNALQTQVTRDFAPLWNIDAFLTTPDVDHSSNPEKIHLLDDSTQADALGYHDRTNLEVPEGFVFVRLSGNLWPGVLSHELLEQLADPLVNLETEGRWKGKPALFFYEDCDPVQDNTYVVDGVTLSDFVTPAYFLGDDPKPPAGMRFNFLSTLTAPLTLDRGGYLSFAYKIGQWQQAFGDKARKEKVDVNPYSRRMRRIKKLARKHGTSLSAVVADESKRHVNLGEP